MNKKTAQAKEKFGGSLILSFLAALLARVVSLGHRSVILRFFRDYDGMEETCKNSCICGKFMDLSSFKVRFLKFKLKCAKYSQESWLIGLFENAAYRFFRANLRSFGVFLLSYGGFLVSVNIANHIEQVLHFSFSKTFLFGCIMIVVSLFMLPVKNRSIASCLHDSRIFSYFLFDVFSIKYLSHAEHGEVLPTSGFSLLGGLLCGLLSYTVSPWLTAFLLFLVLILYIVFTQPENGILLICLCLPFLNAKLLLFLICVTVLSSIFKILRGKRALHFNLCSGACVLLGTVVLSATVYSYDMQNARLSALYLFAALLLALSTITLINSSSLADKCFRMFGVGALLTLLYGLYDYAVIYFANRDSQEVLGRLLQTGISSVFKNSEGFAAFLICMIPLLFFKRRSTGKILSLFAPLALVICLVLTNSYYAVLSLVIAFVITMIVFSRYGVLTACASAVFIYFMKPIMSGAERLHFDKYMPHLDFAAHMPETQYDSIADFFRRLWLCGAGIGNESVAYASVLTDGEITKYTGFGETYVGIMMKIGIPLTILSGVIVFVFFARMLSYAFAKDKSETAKNKCVLLFCSLCALILYALFTDIYADYRMVILVMLLLSLGSAVTDSADNDYIPAYCERDYF